jgi:hypothetical protein
MTRMAIGAVLGLGTGTVSAITLMDRLGVSDSSQSTVLAVIVAASVAAGAALGGVSAHRSNADIRIEGQ